MPAKKSTKKAMSAEHKAALAEGRSQGRAIRDYLEALEAHKPKRGRKRTADSINRRLERIDEDLIDTDVMTRVALVQERLDLLSERDQMTNVVDLTELEKGFVAYAWDYSNRKGITYAAWREVGVSAATLKAAGFSRAAS
jgi:hypothetical protein